jgi:hypothetical protein
MLPSAVRFVEVPLSTSFYFFLQITRPQFVSDILVAPLKSFSFFLLSTCPLATCGGVCKELYILPRIIH